MTAEDLWAMERVGDPALSPDGRWVAFPVTAYSIDENKGNADLWLVPTDGSAPPRRLTWHDGGDSNPVWSPDGGSLLFLSKRGEQKASQLHLLPMNGGEAEPVTDLPVAPQDPRWSPDGRRIYFLASTWPDLNDDWEAVGKRVEEQKDDKVQAKITDTRLLRYWDHYLTSGQALHFFVLDLETREVKDLTPGSERLLPFFGVAGSWDLSPDGAEIAFTANSTEPPYRELNFDVYLMPSAGGDAVNITSGNPAFDGSPAYSPDGRYIVFGRTRRPEIAPDFRRLARYDRDSRKIVGLATDWDGQPGGWTFTPDGKTLLFGATDAGRNHLYALPVAGGEPRVVVSGGTARGVEVGPDGLIVYRLESFHSPAEMMATTLGTDGMLALSKFNAERLAGLDLGRVEDVRFEGADGDEVQMFVLLPPGFDPQREKKWPLLHLVHGGPHGSWSDSFHYRWNAALFASRGHVVTAVNFHGSSGRGQAFQESILGNHADKPFEDLMKATDSMLARGYIDEAYMAAAGGSYGGYMVSWMLGHTDRFAAFINHAGVYDLMGQFASDYTWGRANNYGAAPWEDPRRIDRYSPSRYAKHFNTPTLIIHGEKDYRVPYTQGVNLHGVLTGKGVPSRIVIYPEENHWVLKPQGGLLWWKEVFAWLQTYTGAGAPPATEEEE
jgi:dipeptidyl aminopeptidase/acylaminoacyl peptidase